MIEKIQKEFIEAFKSGDSIKKNALGMLKAKITEKLKSGNVQSELKESDYVEILKSEIKKRQQTLESIVNQTKETALKLRDDTLIEIEEIKKFLPIQMSEEEILSEYLKVKRGIVDSGNPKQKLGLVMKYFNENFKGKFDNQELKKVVENDI